MEKVPAAGYRIVGLPVAGFHRGEIWRNFAFIPKLIRSMLEAKRVVKNFQPDVVIGVGGYASGPTLKMASRLGIPTLIQEQNSYAGVTNRLLAKKAKRICVAYEKMDRYFPADKIIVTGNPVRQDLENIANKRSEAHEYFKLDANRRTLLVLGGSLGARTINQSLLAGLQKLANTDIQVVWQTGSGYFEALNEKVASLNMPNIKVLSFISRMDLAYAAADLVISRAGACTISELCLTGKPAILVPSPNVAEDHQTKNALALKEQDAADMVKDAEAPERLTDVALSLINNEARLKLLSANISKMAKHNSAKQIAEEILKIRLASTSEQAEKGQSHLNNIDES